MCGIAGIILKKGCDTHFLWQKLRLMSEILAHRGPDDEGYWLGNELNTQQIAGSATPEEVSQALKLNDRPSIEAKFGFLHRRLAIQDLSPAGHQPIIGVKSGIGITYNGEIYNYKSLKAKPDSSYPIRDAWRSDTQALLSNWESFGPEFLKDTSGMFAFAVMDLEAKKLFLVRDRVGVKPLYYINTGEIFAFASEQKALLPLLPSKSLNPNAIADYLINTTTEGAGGSFWNEIIEVPAGGLVSFDLHSFQIRSRLWFEPQKTEANLDYDFDEIQDLIRQSVKERLLAAVPIGCCLSGGIDSSLLTAFVKAERAESAQNELHSFTAAFPGFEQDEGHYAQMVSEHLGTINHKISPDIEYFKQHYEKVVQAQDIPFFGASTIAQYGVFSLPRQAGIKVTLDGQGADELFTGYPHHLGFWMRDNVRSGNLAAWFQTPVPAKRKLRMLVDHPMKRADTTMAGICSDSVVKTAIELQQPLPDTLEECLFDEFYGPALKVLLRTGDRNSMAHSVESRVPFADSPQLADKALKIKASNKVKAGMAKIILRHLGAGLIPNQILERKNKIGFAAPEMVWLKALLPEIKDKLKGSELEDYLVVKDLYAQLNLWIGQNKSPQVWKIVNLWAWLNLVNK